MPRKLIFISLLVSALTVTASAQESRVLRSRLLEARPQALRATQTPGATMPLRLFSDASYEAVLENLNESRRNGLVWRGRLADHPYSWVIMVEHKGVIAGVISTGTQVFRVRFAGSGLHVIDEMDPKALRRRGNDAVVPEPFSDPVLPAAQTWSTASSGSGTTEIDVLMVYTKKAARVLLKDKYWWVKETDKKRAIESQAMLSIAVANAALDNSKINAVFRIVGVKKIKGKGSGDMSEDLDRLQDPDDGYFDSAHAMRDQYGADFVVLMLGKSRGNFAGYGYVIPATDPRAPDLAFSSVRSTALWWTLVAHEIGHNMGLVHNPENDDVAPMWRSHPFARGYRDEAAGLATLMSYTSGCANCWNDIPHYSNPKVKWKGRSRPSDPSLLQPKCRGDESPSQPDILFPVCGTPTGTSKFNAARSIKKNRDIFAAYRECRVDCQAGE